MSRSHAPAGVQARRRSWRTLALWALAIVVLTVLGSGVTGRLTAMSLEVPGTPSSRAEALLTARFGHTVPVALLLSGPPAQMEAQGKRLVAALREIRQAQVISPWDPVGTRTTSTDSPTTATALRPGPRAAFVLVNYLRPTSDAMAVVGSTERVISHTVHRPVHSYLTGVAVIGRALQNTTMAATERAELFALPILIIVLLLVFRSPVAAAVPLAMGAATVLAGRGLLWLASFLTPINSLGIAIAAMMSLALGVDYALLMVSRIRQELSRGCNTDTAVAIASRSAGATIAAAGGTLAAAMLAASWVATPGLLGPVAVGVVISGLLSVALALTAMPALLRLLGPRLDRFQLRLPGAHPTGRPGRALALAERLIAHPAVTAPLILAVMLALAIPAGALELGPPDASELPASSPARHAMAMVERTIGPGWPAPFVVVASSRNGPITTRRRLHALIRWQQATARDPDVAAVLGPASVAGAQAKLSQAHTTLASVPTRLDHAHHGIEKLRSGIARATAGIARLRGGLATAASGARSIAAGASRAQHGSGVLATETGRAHKGASKIATAAGRAEAGAGRLARGASHARSGAALLASQTGAAHAGARQLAGQMDRAHAGAKRIASETSAASKGAGQLHTGLIQTSEGSTQLATGLGEAATGAERLAASGGQLSSGAAELATGMDTLDDTVQGALVPLEKLASEIHTWAGWIASLEASQQQLHLRIEAAQRELEAMTTGREDPHYPALAEDLAALAQLIEQPGLSEISQIRERLLGGLGQLSALPTALSGLTASLTRLRTGADRLATGTRESEEGQLALSLALQRLLGGTHQLNDGLAQLGGGASRLAGGLSKLTTAQRRLSGGLGKLSGGSHRLATGLGKLTAGERRLSGGLGTLTGGGQRLARGLGHLTAGSTRLASGLSLLTTGQNATTAGLGRLSAAGTTLAGGLAAGEHQTLPLATGLAHAQRPLGRYESVLSHYRESLRQLHRASPNALDSGYLVLTALDGTTGASREQVAQLINVNSGGQAARIMVVAASPPSSPATAALSRRLQRTLPTLAADTGSDVQIGQGAQYLLDYTNANTARVPWLVLALALVATLTLILVLRAPLLALLAVVLNLATIAVALGALQLLTTTHILGGPGYIDAASGAGIIAIMFVLSIDYEVFLLTRMREHWVTHHNPQDAIRHGLRNTASVITGSAAIMTAVFLAFAVADVTPLRQFGVGLTLAVLLDSTIVRLVLLPSIMRLAGPRIWWLPRWLTWMPVLERPRPILPASPPKTMVPV